MNYEVETPGESNALPELFPLSDALKDHQESKLFANVLIQIGKIAEDLRSDYVDAKYKFEDIKSAYLKLETEYKYIHERSYKKDDALKEADAKIKNLEIELKFAVDKVRKEEEMTSELLSVNASIWAEVNKLHSEIRSLKIQLRKKAKR